jgi:hypothetical protein
MTDTLPAPDSRDAATAVRADRLPCAADADEPMGGDPPCWAHLFEEDETSSDR